MPGCICVKCEDSRDATIASLTARLTEEETEHDKVSAHAAEKIADLTAKLGEAERQRETIRANMHDAEGLLASATDLLNSWAREHSVTEARCEENIKQVINGLWDRTMEYHQRATTAETALREMREAAAEYRKLFCVQTYTYKRGDGARAWRRLYAALSAAPQTEVPQEGK